MLGYNTTIPKNYMRRHAAKLTNTQLSPTYGTKADS